MEANIKKMEAQNFLGDAFNMLQELNRVNGKDLSKEEKEVILEKLDEFSTAFIYFRESYDESQSNIHKLSEKVEDIRQIAAVGEKLYGENEGDLEKLNQILMNMIQNIMSQLLDIDNLTKDAMVEETQNRQLNVIKDIFIETKKDIDGAEMVFRDVQAKMVDQSTSLKTNLDSVQSSLKAFEDNLVETKSQLDGMKQISENIMTGFNEWKGSSGNELEASLKGQVEVVNQKIEAYLTNIDTKSNETSSKIEKMTNDASNKVEKLADRVESLLTGEGVKQFLIYGGTALTGLNFILLIIMMFFGK